MCMLFSDVVCIFCYRELRGESTWDWENEDARQAGRRAEALKRLGKETNGIEGKRRALQWGLETERLRGSREFSPTLGDMKACFLGSGQEAEDCRWVLLCIPAVIGDERWNG